MQLVSATLEHEGIAFTLFREDIKWLEQLCDVPPFLAEDARRRFAITLLSKAVDAETGEPIWQDGRT